MDHHGAPGAEAGQRSLTPALAQEFEDLLEEHLDSALKRHIDVLFCRLKALLQDMSGGGDRPDASQGAGKPADSPVNAGAERGLSGSALEPYEDVLESPRHETTERSKPHVRFASVHDPDLSMFESQGDALEELSQCSHAVSGMYSPRPIVSRLTPHPQREPVVGPPPHYSSVRRNPCQETKEMSEFSETVVCPPPQYPSKRSDRCASDEDSGLNDFQSLFSRGISGTSTTSLHSTAHREIARQKSLDRQLTTVSPGHSEHDRFPPRHYSCVRRMSWRIVKSLRFEVFVAGSVMTNVVFVGVQIEYAAQCPAQQEPTIFLMFSIVYTLIFTIELLVRLAALGPRFFCCSDGLGWNYLDLLIVASSFLELGVVAASGTQQGAKAESAMADNMRFVRFIRVARIMRAIRIVKVVRFVRGLRSLVYSIIFTLRGLAWSMVLLMMIMYVFALVFTDAVTQHLVERFGEEHRPTELALIERFGTLHMSMHTLFRSISNGLTWDPVVESLIEVNWAFGYFFSIYIAFCCFAVLNVMTAVFCQSAKDSAERDRDLMVQTRLMDKQRSVMIIEQLFKSLDMNKAGSLTMHEFEKHFQDERVRALFQLFELEPCDAWTLFKLLDTQGTGDVDVEDFVEGCLRLKGPAKSIDIAVLMNDQRMMKKRLQRIEASGGHTVKNVKELLSLCTKMSAEQCGGVAF